jgi:hypothetical protein
MRRPISGTRRYRFWLLLILISASAWLARADSPAFDLMGPRLEIQVTRGSRTLPIANVANLQPGDLLWVRTDFPASQSVHYLLILAFLRGSTNPPPEEWFTKAETWDPRVGKNGTKITVPEGAQQALLFLAPETSGGFGTLRSTVRSKPGVFVRAAQDLNQAGLDRSRLDEYLDEIRAIAATDPAELHARSELLAKALNIKLDQMCFDKPTEQQGPCLMQGNDALLMDDPHSQSLVAALASGPSSDLIGTLSSAPAAGAGAYSPYVGAVMDLARLLGNLRTAEYQYIPALALPKHDLLNLRLNNPPSFHKPQSVLVVGLPGVGAVEVPSLHAAKSGDVYCLEQPSLGLPVEGEPLAFSTELAHDFILHLGAKPEAVNLPAKADAARGGFVLDLRGLKTAQLDGELEGKLEGYWGFDAFEGPKFHLRAAHNGDWALAPAEKAALVAGRDSTFHLKSGCAVCVEQVAVKDEHSRDLHATWKLAEPGELELRLSLKDEQPGTMHALVKQFGVAKPDDVKLRVYGEAPRLDALTIFAGEQHGSLDGLRLDEIERVELAGTAFMPAGLQHAGNKETLTVAAAKATSGSLPAAGEATAHITLRDGRVLELQTAVEPPRPKVELLNKKVLPGTAPSHIRFGNQDELPDGGRITFLLRSSVPEAFPRTEKIEVATADGASDTLLSTSGGALMPQDSRTFLAVFEPLKAFGPAAFGLLQFRAVSDSGSKGDWQPLARLVRVPTLQQVRCPASPDRPCELSGTNLFLIDSVAADAQFSHPISVPLGYLETTLTVPRPNGTLLYVKLRDDPSTVDTLILPVLPDEPERPPEN